MLEGKFILRNSRFVIAPVENLEGGGQVRESMNVTENGELSGGHTTVQVPGRFQPLRIPWSRSSG